MNTLQAIIIAIIEGLTEYLPISSTAHMGFTASLLGVPEDEYLKCFQVSIQFGAILSIVVLYWRKFFDKIEAVLGNQKAIAITLILGGVILIFVDRWFKHQRIDNEKEIGLKKAVIIGFWQCLAMMPGTSRSAASIIGGMTQGLTRKAAAEFSFFLAVPTMLAVTVYSLFLKKWGAEGELQQKGYELVMASSESFWLFILGNIVAFVVAMIAVKFFIHILTKFGFKVWGIYRIVIGTLLLFIL